MGWSSNLNHISKAQKESNKETEKRWDEEEKIEYEKSPEYREWVELQELIRKQEIEHLKDEEIAKAQIECNKPHPELSRFHNEIWWDLQDQFTGDREQVGRIKEILLEITTADKKVAQEQLAKKFHVDRTTIYRLLKGLIQKKLITSIRGYRPSARVSLFYRFLREGNAPEIANELGVVAHET